MARGSWWGVCHKNSTAVSLSSLFNTTTPRCKNMRYLADSLGSTSTITSGTRIVWTEGYFPIAMIVYYQQTTHQDQRHHDTGRTTIACHVPIATDRLGSYFCHGAFSSSTPRSIATTSSSRKARGDRMLLKQC